MTKSFIGYARVSSAKQFDSGLSLEHQQSAIAEFVSKAGGQLSRIFVEQESGKRNDRPQLMEAIAACKKSGATLIISRLDRLGRRVSLIASLLESKIDIICADNPAATKTMLQMLSVFAEFERDMISQRTREALQAAKLRGARLGSYGADVLSQRNHARANEFATGLTSVVAELRAQGHNTVRAMTDALNASGVVPAGGNSRKWHTASTHRMLKRIEAMQAA